MRRLLLTIGGALAAFAAMAALPVIVVVVLAAGLAAGVGLLGGLGSVALGLLLHEPSGVRAGLSLLLIGAVAFVALVLTWDGVFGAIALLRCRRRGFRDAPFHLTTPLRVTQASTTPR